MQGEGSMQVVIQDRCIWQRRAWNGRLRGRVFEGVDTEAKGSPPHALWVQNSFRDLETTVGCRR